MDDVLNYFGEILIRDVRDKTIHRFDMRINGKMQDENSQELFEKVSKLNEDSIRLIGEIIPQVVDLSIHNMLCMFEENMEIEVRVENECISEITDGLAGELYSEDGWIQKFSKQRHEEIVHKKADSPHPELQSL